MELLPKISSVNRNVIYVNLILGRGIKISILQVLNIFIVNLFNEPFGCKTLVHRRR